MCAGVAGEGRGDTGWRREGFEDQDGAFMLVPQLTGFEKGAQHNHPLWSARWSLAVSRLRGFKG